MKILKLVCITILAFNLSAKALIRNVPNQYSTIQLGINACSNTDTLLVQPGTYFENINFRGKKIVVTSLYYQNNNYSIIQSTITNGSTPVFPDTASCVIISHGEDSTTVLQGFTLTGGSGTKWQDEHGAGLYREGSGILIQYSSPVIQYNIISDNHSITGGVVSTGGGGMRIGDSYPRVFNNIIMNNSARYGAGVVINYTGGEFRNNVICKNFGSLDYGAGSGIWLNGVFIRTATFENNTIVANTATAGYAGISGFGGVIGVFRNNIVWGNISPQTAQISGPGLQVRYCDVMGSYAGAGNINVDPGFDSTNYYLSSSSLCIDKGDSSIIYNDPADIINPALAKWPARGNLRNDLGAYGGPGSKVIANSVVGIKTISESITPDKFYLEQNYPNPFNPVTHLAFGISNLGFVSLKVYDALGEEVAVLVNENLSPGSYAVEFSGANLSSGVYFYKLDIDGQAFETKSMVLVK